VEAENIIPGVANDVCVVNETIFLEIFITRCYFMTFSLFQFLEHIYAELFRVKNSHANNHQSIYSPKAYVIEPAIKKNSQGFDPICIIMPFVSIFNTLISPFTFNMGELASKVVKKLC